jgi:hypothetical protein
MAAPADGAADVSSKSPTESVARLSGELTSAPKGPFVSALFVLSGFSLLRGACRLAGRLAFAYRRPAELRLSRRGVEIKHRTELLGRVLRDRETVIPLSNVASISREIRFARLGLYSGLFALAVGTYVGAGLVVDGARVPGGSPSLLGFGLLAIVLGIVLDYGLAVAWDVVKQTCRLVVTPQRGPALCIQGLDPQETDRVLEELSTMLAANASSERLETA